MTRVSWSMTYQNWVLWLRSHWNLAHPQRFPEEQVYVSREAKAQEFGPITPSWSIFSALDVGASIFYPTPNRGARPPSTLREQIVHL